MARGREEVADVRSWSVVTRRALGQQHDLVEEVEDLLSRLMHGTDDTAPVLREVLDGLHDVEGGVRVQPRCGFVQEQNAGVRDQLDSNGCTLAFSSTHPSTHGIANARVSAVRQSFLRYNNEDWLDNHRVIFRVLVTDGAIMIAHNWCVPGVTDIS